MDHSKRKIRLVRVDSFVLSEGLVEGKIYEIDLRRDAVRNIYYVNGKPYDASRFETVTEGRLNMAVVKGTTKDGSVVFYTGRAGDNGEWISPSIKEAFQYSPEGAATRAKMLNVGSFLHGIRFEVLSFEIRT